MDWTRQPSRLMRITAAPTDRIDEHSDVLEDFMRRVCELEPGEYVMSDESLLTDLSMDADPLFTAVRDIYGIDVPRGKDQPYLWQIIDQIARTRRDH